MSRYLLSIAALALGAVAQSASPYTDAKSGITFNGLQAASGMTFGVALPENPTTDLIGQIVAPVNSTGGWAGASLGSAMANKLLIVAWPNNGAIVSSFRVATGYTSPPVYNPGNISLEEISTGTFINDTHFSYTFLCKGCITGDDLSFSSTDESTVLAWAYSTDAVTNPSSASSALTYHAAGFGLFGFTLANATSSKYETWAAMATASNSTSSTGNSTTVGSGTTNSTSSTAQNTTATVSNTTYDYIIAGAGPAGIIVAERLVESGASVLLIERGGPSLALTGNTNMLSWNDSMTAYDVPGLAYYLSTMSGVAYCTDTASQAGCLLGGGTMVNALNFIRPQDADFDDAWPQGWKSADMTDAASRLYERIPGYTHGSMDGKHYNDEAYDVVSTFLSGNGFTSVDAIEQPNEKKNVFTHPSWSVKDGLRDSPVRSYLPLAQAKSNFKLQLNTQVIRAVRNGSTITGVEMQDITGARTIVNVKNGGSVILAAGAMSSPRILFNSGIGPTEQIQTVASGSTGVTLPAQADWINLPVGSEIKDHSQFMLKFTTKSNMSALPSTAWTTPDQTNIDLFAKGDGILAQSGQRLTFWADVETSGKTHYVQGTCFGPENNTIEMKILFTHGTTSVGSLGITADGATTFITEPWFTTDEDKEVATTFFDRLLGFTRQANSTLTFLSEGDSGKVSGANVTGADILAAKDWVTGSHFVGSAKMGTDDGRTNGTSVVDLSTKVYGTDNLFVVDASIHPDLPTGNTQAIIMVAAEQAAAKILALKGSNSTSTLTGSVGAADASSSTLPLGTGIPASSAVAPIGAGISTAAPSASSTLATVPSSPQETESRHHGHQPATSKHHGHQGHQTPTPKPKATPTARAQARIPRVMRRDGVKRAVGPDLVADEREVMEMVRRERASFLDSY